MFLKKSETLPKNSRKSKPGAKSSNCLIISPAEILSLPIYSKPDISDPEKILPNKAKMKMKMSMKIGMSKMF